MKKLLFVALAAVGMTACVQNEELAVSNDKSAIAFDTFVENATKASAYDNTNLNKFYVYGTISQNGTVVTNIFDGVEVRKTNDVWAYGSQYTQYWIPGFRYDFAAVVDGTVVKNSNNMPEYIEVDMTEQEDVLYATAGRDFGANDVAAKVGFTFDHLLAKAKFTVKNGIVNGQNFVYNVESIIIKNADKDATYTVNGDSGVWTATNTYEASFGAISEVGQLASKDNDTEILLVPGTKELAIEIVYSLTYTNPAGNVATLVDREKKDLTAVLTLEQGKAYNFVVEFGNPGEDIKFDAMVKDWTEGGNVTPGTSYVATAEEFTTAFAAEGIDRIVLAGDVVLTAGATRAADPSFVLNNGKELTIDLDGKTLTANFTAADASATVFDVRGTLNIEDGTVIMNREDAAFNPNYRTCVFCTSFDGVVNLNGVTAKNNGGAGMAYVLDMSNATNAAYNVENSTLESTYIAVRIFNNNNNGVHNATIKNSTLKGKYCFWVQYYLADGRTQEELDRQLQLDIYNNENTFEPAAGKLPILFGYNSYVSANGDGITKSVSEDGTVVTLGSLVENGVVGRGVAGAEKNSTITSVILKDGIAELPNRTFYRYFALETVELPSTLTVLGAAGDATTNGNVFQGCTALKNIVIPESVTTMGPGAFYGCTALETVNIPSGVTRIEKDTFRETGIKKIEFHEGVTYIGQWAFRDCEVLEQIVINAPSFTVEADTFTNMARPYPNFTIYVANAEMKTYLEGMLDTEEKKYITVVAPEVIDNTAALQAALAEGKDVVLANNLTITPEEMSTAPYGNKMALSQNGGVFNGKGKAISVTANGDNYVLMTNGGTIKNLNIDRGFRGVVLMSPTQDVYVDNVKVGVNDEVCYTINTAEGDGTHSLYVSNSVLNGWCSIGTAVKDVTFTNCTFGQGTYYTDVYGRLVKPYVNAVFDGCDFCNKCYLDLSSFVGTKIIVKNCTVNGVKITAENWASLVAPESTCKDGQISVELKNGSYLTAENVADYIVFE